MQQALCAHGRCRLPAVRPGRRSLVCQPHGSSHRRPQHASASTAAAISLSSGLPLGPKELPGVPFWQRLSPLGTSSHDAEIVAVATPALVAMLMDPVVGAINSAFVGQIGTKELGALSIGSLAVSFNIFLFAFLLYLTIPEVADAVSRKDKALVSRVAAKGIWVAIACGLFSFSVTFFGADTIVSFLRPPEPAVAAFAAEFIKVRAFSIIPCLIGYVAVAVFRGHKDTRTPLSSAVASATCSLTLNILFLHVLKLGVAGAALASTLAVTLSTSILCQQMVAQGLVRVADLVRPPPWSEVVPLFRASVPLILRNVVSFGMILYASSLCVRAGSVYQASFEIIRQVWFLSIQSFECLNVATQVMCSAYLGSREVATARAVLRRLAFLGSVAGGLTAIVLYAVQQPFIQLFTHDPAVMNQVLMTLPMVCLMLPLDALASIFDGSLMAAKQTDYLSAVQIIGAGFQYMVLAYLSSSSLASALTVWGALKALTLFRVGGGFYRSFVSVKGAYRLPSSTVSAPVAAAAAAAPAAAAAATAATAVAATVALLESADEDPSEPLCPTAPTGVCAGLKQLVRCTAAHEGEEGHVVIDAPGNGQQGNGQQGNGRGNGQGHAKGGGLANGHEAVALEDCGSKLVVGVNGVEVSDAATGDSASKLTAVG